jgi:hypothetical protein
MKTNEAIKQIQSFLGLTVFHASAGRVVIERIKKEFETPLSEELIEYIELTAPSEDVDFETVGNPMTIYSFSRLGSTQDGFNFNSVKNEKIEDWNPDWFLIADEGADPVIIDLSKKEMKVMQASHGMGEWDFHPIADSIGQFLLCQAAIHYAMTNWGADSIIDDEDGFNLAPEPAVWLFPKMKEWAGEYYSDWCSVFDNH